MDRWEALDEVRQAVVRSVHDIHCCGCVCRVNEAAAMSVGVNLRPLRIELAVQFFDTALARRLLITADAAGVAGADRSLQIYFALRWRGLCQNRRG